jgi:hypothetical protein
VLSFSQDRDEQTISQLGITLAQRAAAVWIPAERCLMTQPHQYPQKGAVPDADVVAETFLA